MTGLAGPGKTLRARERVRVRAREIEGLGERCTIACVCVAAVQPLGTRCLARDPKSLPAILVRIPSTSEHTARP